MVLAFKGFRASQEKSLLRGRLEMPGASGCPSDVRAWRGLVLGIVNYPKQTGQSWTVRTHSALSASSTLAEKHWQISLGLQMPHQGAWHSTPPPPPTPPILQMWALRLREVKALELDPVLPDSRIHILSMAFKATSPKHPGKWGDDCAHHWA